MTLRRLKPWIIVFALVFVIGCPCIQTWRYREAARPFKEVGAWVYSGGDDMGIPVYGPAGIREIYFYDKEFGDVEMEKIKDELTKYPGLTALHLERTQISDKSLQHFLQLPISRLNLVGTNTTAGGVAEFRRKKPTCHVFWEQPSQAENHEDRQHE